MKMLQGYFIQSGAINALWISVLTLTHQYREGGWCIGSWSSINTLLVGCWSVGYRYNGFVGNFYFVQRLDVTCQFVRIV